MAVRKKKFNEEIEELKYCTIFKQYSNWLLNSGAFVSFRTIVPFFLVLTLVICIILFSIHQLFILSLTSLSVQNDSVFIVNFVNFLKLFFSNENFISMTSMLLLKMFFHCICCNDCRVFRYHLYSDVVNTVLVCEAFTNNYRFSK